MHRPFEGNDPGIGAKSRGNEARRGLRKPQGGFCIHLVMQGTNKSRIEGISAARGVDDLDLIGWRRNPRAILMRIEGAIPAKGEDAAAGAPIEEIPGAIGGCLLLRHVHRLFDRGHKIVDGGAVRRC